VNFYIKFFFAICLAGLFLIGFFEFIWAALHWNLLLGTISGVIILAAAVSGALYLQDRYA
jgi:hypothetical protein